jgi:hypothetical protein
MDQTMPSYFADYERVGWNYVKPGPVSNQATTDAVAHDLVGADTVIFEVGERYYVQMAKPVSAKAAGPAGTVVANINNLTEAIRAQPRR